MQAQTERSNGATASSRESVRPPALGSVLDGRYRVVRSIGAGAMGAVFECEQLSIGRRCAIKFLRGELAAHPRSAARFEREARLLGKLEHEHLTAVLDYGHYLERFPYIVMEFVEGRTLRLALREGGALAVDAALPLIQQLARGMAHVHAQGIVHRDLKPENVMLRENSDGRPWIKILDFGIARAPEDEGVQLTRSGAELGTAHYMSPEQARGERDIGPASDVYALGAIAYEALTGQKVHPGHSYNEVIFQLLTQPHRPLDEALPDCPAALCEIVERCLEKRPARRYADAAELGQALARVTAAESAGAVPHQRERRTARQRLVVARGLAAALCGGVAIGGGSALVVLERSHGGDCAPLGAPSDAPVGAHADRAHAVPRTTPTRPAVVDRPGRVLQEYATTTAGDGAMAVPLERAAPVALASAALPAADAQPSTSRDPSAAKPARSAASNAAASNAAASTTASPRAPSSPITSSGPGVSSVPVSSVPVSPTAVVAPAAAHAERVSAASAPFPFVTANPYGEP